MTGVLQDLAGLTGEVHLPGSPGYEVHRRVWNGFIDKHPAAVVRPSCVEDVQAAVRFAAASGLPLAVRGGGHNVAGLGTCDDGIVVDLSTMRQAVVDPVRRTATVGGGARWADLDAAAAMHGLATPGGQVSSTGVGGLTLGGGIGWLVRTHGLSCDNLLGATLVTADGQVRQVTDATDPELMWALRGGGGNFGVCVELVLRLHPVTTVVGGVLLFPLSRARAVLGTVRDLGGSAPDGFTMSAGFWTPPGGEPSCGVALCHLDRAATDELAALRAHRPSYDDVTEQPYVALQQVFDEGSPAGLRNAARAEYLRDLPDAALDILVEEGNRLPSAFSQILLAHLGGAVARVPLGATAFGHRTSTWLLNALAIWEDPADDERLHDWSRRVRAAVMPWSSGGVYVNFLAEEGQDRVADAYAPEVHARLVAVKTRVDPGNVFRVNQNIRPA